MAEVLSCSSYKGSKIKLKMIFFAEFRNETWSLENQFYFDTYTHTPLYRDVNNFPLAGSSLLHVLRKSNKMV